jgi:hypothetical protein
MDANAPEQRADRYRQNDKNLGRSLGNVLYPVMNISAPNRDWRLR